jgi:hypothetical protein
MRRDGIKLLGHSAIPLISNTYGYGYCKIYLFLRREIERERERVGLFSCLCNRRVQVGQTSGFLYLLCIKWVYNSNAAGFLDLRSADIFIRFTYSQWRT